MIAWSPRIKEFKNGRLNSAWSQLEMTASVLVAHCLPQAHAQGALTSHAVTHQRPAQRKRIIAVQPDKPHCWYMLDAADNSFPKQVPKVSSMETMF
jgi:hypothetical protein